MEEREPISCTKERERALSVHPARGEKGRKARAVFLPETYRAAIPFQF